MQLFILDTFTCNELRVHTWLSAMHSSEALPQNAADVKAKLAAERGVAAIAARSDSETDTLVTALVDGVAICGRSALEAIKSSDSTKRSVDAKDEQTATDYSMALGSQPVQSSSMVTLADTHSSKKGCSNIQRKATGDRRQYQT